MFGTIRKHQKWLWLVIIAFTVISFVVYFSPYQRLSRGLGGRAVNFGTINGERVTPESYREAQADVFLLYRLTRGDWPDKDATAKRMGFDGQRETYYRLLLIQKLNELNVQVGDKAVGRLATDFLQSIGRGGGAVSLGDFERQVLQERGMTADDFERFLRHELGIQQLISVAGLSGTLVTPLEAQALYRHEHEELTATIVVFPATNQLARVEVTPDAVAQFYTNQLARYRIPECVQVSYVKFDLTNFWADADREMAKVTNLTAVIDRIYEQRGTNYYREAKSPDEARQIIKDELRKRAALSAARKQAAEFAEVPFNEEPVRAANLAEAAARSNLTVKVTAPFDRDYGPAELEVRSDFARAAFNLTEDVPFAGPIIGEDGVYVIALNKKLPSEVPLLDAIRDRVTADFKYSQAVNLARQAGASFYSVLTNGMAHGISFSSICLDARLKPIMLGPFSRSTRSLPDAEERVQLGLLQETAFKVPPGNVSNFIPTSDGGFIVHVRSRLPLDESRMEADMPAFLSMLRRAGQSEAFNEWFAKQKEVGLRDTPFARPANPSLTSRSGG
jgi:hypothetical protein